jgi:antitoxin CptB
MKELERLRWRCRRGLLELDLVLERFVGGHYAALDADARRAFDALLDMPDAVLWDMITARSDAPQSAAQRAVLELIRAA